MALGCCILVTLGSVLSGSRSRIMFMPLKRRWLLTGFDSLRPESWHGLFLRAGDCQEAVGVPRGDAFPRAGDTKAPAEPHWMTCHQQVTPGPCLLPLTDGDWGAPRMVRQPNSSKGLFVTDPRLFCSWDWQGWPLSKFLSAFLSKAKSDGSGKRGWWTRLQRTRRLRRVRCKRPSPKEREEELFFRGTKY